jgi:transposase InsO family protein
MREGPGSRKKKSHRLPRGARGHLIAWLGAPGSVERGNRGQVARALELTERGLRYVVRQGEPARIGRPPHDPSVRWHTVLGAARVLRIHRYGVGWRTVAREMVTAPTGVLKACVPALKRRHRVRVARARTRRRVTLVVERPGVLVTEDSFQAAGTRQAPVAAELLRDAATTRYEGGSVGGPTQSADVIALLTRLEASGRSPLVLGTDNGVYRSSAVQAHLTAHGIVWFPSRRHTPQDNGGMERGIREVQEAAGDMEGLGPEGIAARLAETTARINGSCPRPSRGGFTAEELTSWLPACEADVRPRFFAVATAAIAVAVSGAAPRQARVAWRQAVIQTMEEFGLARRVRGGGAPAPQEAERLT